MGETLAELPLTGDQVGPIATKRSLRAILKAADLCASEPTVAARLLVDGGFTPRYDYTLQALRDVPYDRWREYDPEDTIRFYTLRMRDPGSSSPPRKRSSPTAPIGAFSTSSNAS